MNFEKPFLYNEEAANNVLQSVENDKNTVGIIDDSGIFYLRNESEFQRLHSYFYDLTFNKINHTNKISQEKKEKYREYEDKRFVKENTFKPKIDSLSESIEMNKNVLFGNIPRYELLLSKGILYQETNSNKVNKLKNKEVEDCTFVPNTSKSSIKERNSRLKNLKRLNIEETRTQLKDSLKIENTINMEGTKGSIRKTKGKKGDKRLKPKVNQVFMSIISGKDPVIEKQEVVNEYNVISRTSELSENQQSSSLDERISYAQQ